MKNDLRSPSAIARDEWLMSEEGKRCRYGFADGQYLENRLVLAFFAGMKAQENLSAKEAPCSQPKP